MLETGKNSWNGTRVRKGELEGVVVQDSNYIFRILTVKMDDGSMDEIKMHNTKEDPPEVHEWEWFSGKFERPAQWRRF